MQSNGRERLSNFAGEEIKKMKRQSTQLSQAEHSISWKKKMATMFII